MAARDEPLPWAQSRCQYDGECTGIQLDHELCLAHCGPNERRAALEKVRQGEPLDFTRGVTIDAGLLRELLTADPKGRLVEANFNRATFLGEVAFPQVIFSGGASFYAATFKGLADFYGSTFSQGPRGLWFTEAIFEGGAGFNLTKFEATPRFDNTMFNAFASFSEATFEEGANFLHSIFGGTLSIELSRIKGPFNFDRAIFKDQVLFGRAPFREGGVSFRGATFEKALQLGRLVAKDTVVLDNAVFQQRLQLEVSAAGLSCRRVRFLDGVHMRLRWSGVGLEDADLAHLSILSSSNYGEPEEAEFHDHWRSWAGPPRPDAQPWLASLQRADVAGLALGDVNLQAARFAGAHNLDRLRLESPKAFARTPSWKAIETGWVWPPAWRWTNRQVLGEEHAWRATHERGIRQVGWHDTDTWAPDDEAYHWVPNPRRIGQTPGSRLLRHLVVAARRWRQSGRRFNFWRRLYATRRHAAEEETRRRRDQAREIGNVYRALRKGREDNKDEPGAADFYYGEMEMRRKATPLSAEWGILTLYWLVSGYALRAWRAFTAVILTLVVFAVLMVGFGFRHPPQSSGTTATAPARSTPSQRADTSFAGAIVYGARTAIGLQRDPQPQLTRIGDVLQIGLRVLVPVLLGLGILSIRGRVKR